MSPGTPAASPPDAVPPDTVPAEVIDLLRERYEIQVASSVKQTGGTDDHASLWRVEDVAGQTYAVKLSRGALTAGLVAAAQPPLAGVPGIAPPKPTRSGALWRSLPGAQLAVFPWVDGRGGTEGPLIAESWRRFGALMATIHRVSTVVDLGAPLPEETFHPAAAARVRRLARRIDRLAERGAGASVDGPLDEISRQVVHAWTAAADVITEVAERAVTLGDDLSQRPCELVLTHGDCHLFNVVVADDEQVWLLDWVDAALAPPERDLLFFIGGIFADAQLSAEEQRWFFDGYGPVEIDGDRLTYYRSVRALEDLEWAERALDRHRSDDERDQALGFLRGVLSPAGMVAQALSTRRE